MVPTNELRKGPVRHELDGFMVDVARWSYKVVGHYVARTLEEWELDFMRDAVPEQEIGIWHRIAFAFITYHKRNGLLLRSDEEEGQLVGKLVMASAGGDADKEIQLARGSRPFRLLCKNGETSLRSARTLRKLVM